LNQSYRKSGVDPSRRVVAKAELQEKLDEFLSRGGAITKCAPGPSEGIVYRNAGRMRGRPRPAAEAAPAAEALPEEVLPEAVLDGDDTEADTETEVIDDDDDDVDPVDEI